MGDALWQGTPTWEQAIQIQRGVFQGLPEGTASRDWNQGVFALYNTEYLISSRGIIWPEEMYSDLAVDCDIRTPAWAQV